MTFSLSAPGVKGLPPDRGMEIAFAGRSNAGKSSALNSLAGKKSLAKTSSVPGKTRHLNLFTLGQELRIADLPGYGYAKVPLNEKKRWQKEMTNYILHRECLKGIVLLMDIRHPLTELDCNMLDLAVEGNREVHIVLNKADKVNTGTRNKTIREMNQALRGLPIPWSLQSLSNLKNTGIQELRRQITFWAEEPKMQASRPG